MADSALAEVPPLADDDAAPATDPPAEKQLKIDGMPVTDEYVVITGRIRVARSLVAKWKIGKPMEITVAAIVDSRRQKAKRNGPDATGEVEQQHVLQITDLIVDE